MGANDTQQLRSGLGEMTGHRQLFDLLFKPAVRHSCAVEASETNSDYMPPKLNNCPSWDFGHLGNGCHERGDSIRMSHDVAVHIIVNST